MWRTAKYGKPDLPTQPAPNSGDTPPACQVIRKKYGLEPAPCSDCMVHCELAPCASIASSSAAVVDALLGSHHVIG